MQTNNENSMNTPAFLGKLWKIVNDPSTNSLVNWNKNGTSFIIQNKAQFWYELLPIYYKHNNMSSFIRQLNMYGFHKIPIVENVSMVNERNEIQFYHPFFQKGHPELLKEIKRKATTHKLPTTETEVKIDELNKILSDVKQLGGRQQNIDKQLAAIKEENGLVWRELAFLRQKHLTQQKIVNKLIQFLVTLVQPTRMSVKRGCQLMLNESNENKKHKSETNVGCSSNSGGGEGPTIHELDSELEISPDLYDDVEETPLINSPVATGGNSSKAVDSPPLLQQQETEENVEQQQENVENAEVYWDKPQYVKIHSKAAEEDTLIARNELAEEKLMNTLEEDTSKLSKADSEKIFLNPSAQDAMLINLIKNNTEGEASSSNDNKNGIDENVNKKNNVETNNTKSSGLIVATCDPNLCGIKNLPSTSEYYSPDLHNHVETTQSELEQLKELLNGAFDANALLGLFSDEAPSFGLSLSPEKGCDLVSGSELATYNPGIIDFNELFDDSLDGQDFIETVSEIPPSTINTPQIKNEEPTFPGNNNNNK